MEGYVAEIDVTFDAVLDSSRDEIRDDLLETVKVSMNARRGIPVLGMSLIPRCVAIAVRLPISSFNTSVGLNTVGRWFSLLVYRRS